MTCSKEGGHVRLGAEGYLTVTTCGQTASNRQSLQTYPCLA